MKKIFTLIAVAAMALSASAQEISFTEADVVAAASSAPLNNKTFSNGNFSITITDLEGKFAIDGSNAFFGTAESYKSYSYRLKTNSTSKAAGDAKARYITIKAPSAGTVKVCARSASTGTDRNIEINGTKKLLDDDAAAKVDMAEKISETNPTGTTPVYQIHEFAVNAGDNTLNFPDGGVNFYSFEFVAGEGGGGEGGGEGGGSSTDPSAAKTWDFTNMSSGALDALASSTNWTAETQGSGEEAYTRYTYNTDIAKDTYVDLASIGFSDGAGIEVARSGGSLPGYTIKDGKGSGGIRVDANKRLQLNCSNGLIKITNLTAGDNVVINYQSASDEARTFTVTNATPATLSAPKNSEEGSNKTETLTVTANGDVILLQSKAINIFKISLNGGTTGIAAVTTTATAAPAVKKYVENGQVVIVKAGKKFNVAGAQLK